MKDLNLINLCPFDVLVDGVRLDRPAEQLFPLRPMLGDVEMLGGCLVPHLRGYRLPRVERALWRPRGLDVLVPRLGAAVDLVRRVGARPWVLPEDVERVGGDVKHVARGGVTPPPDALTVVYRTRLPAWPGREDGVLLHRMTCSLPIRLRGTDREFNAGTFPLLVKGPGFVEQFPENTAGVIVSHDEGCISYYEARDVPVLVPSPPYPDGTVDLYRVA